MRKSLKKISTLAMTLAMCVGLSSVAFAADVDSTVSAADIDASKTGSITIELKDTDGELVTDGALSLYQIEELQFDDATGTAEYVITDNYRDCDIDNLSEAEACEAYAEWTRDNNIEGETVAMTSEGNVVFNGLSLGVYLVLQTEDAEDYYTMSPFLVTVPNSMDGVVVYDVEASPKMSAIEKVPIDETKEDKEENKQDEEQGKEENVDVNETKNVNNTKTGDNTAIVCVSMIAVSAALAVLFTYNKIRKRA